MPSIGELFVTLGAKTDASLTDGLKKLQSLGVAAKQSAQMINDAARHLDLKVWGALATELNSVQGEFKQVGNAAKNTARDVSNAARAARSSLESLRVANIAASSRGRGGMDWAADFKAEQQRMAQSLGPKLRQARSAGNDALEAMWADLSGAPRGDVNRARRSVGWGEFMAGAPQGDNRSYVMGNRQIFGRPGTGGPGGRGAGHRPGGGGGGGGGARPGGGGGGGGFGNRPYGPLGEASQLRRVLLGAGVYQGAEYLANIADSYTQINNRLRQVSTSEEDVARRFDRLRQIALKTHSDFAKTSEAYVRITMATKGMKLSEEDSFKLMERISMAFKTSGQTSQEAASSMIQLTQAFNKGKLDGDEFRTMAEEMPAVLDVLATTLKKPKDQLYDLARQGKLTRDVMIKAFLNNNEIEKQFAGYRTTFKDMAEDFKTNLIEPIGKALSDPEIRSSISEIIQALGYLAVTIIPPLVKGLAAVVKYIAEFIKGLKEGKPWAIGLAIAIGTMLIPQLIAMVLWMTRMAALPFTTIIGQIGKIKALMGGDFAGAGLNTNIMGGGVATGKGGVGGAAGGVANGVGTIPLIGQAVAAGMALREGTKYLGNKMGFDTSSKSLFSALTGTANERLLGGDGNDAAAMAAGNSWLFGSSGSMLPGDPGTKGIANLQAAERMNGNSVNVGPTTVNIYAKDGKDAAEQFTQEMTDRMMRHVAASVNRPGS